LARKLLHMLVIAVKMLCAIVAFFGMVFTVYAIGPSIETRLFPVVSKLEIVSIQSAGANQTEVRAAFRKIRDCEYVGISWFVGNRAKDYERVTVQLMRDPNDTSSPNRPLGYQRAGPWVIGVPPQELQNNSFARLVHRCHPFWPSMTEFFP
jgi:hypothetical protein